MASGPGPGEPLAGEARPGGLVGLVRAVLFGGSDSSLVQFLRYAIVGGLAFAVDFGLFWALTSAAPARYLVWNIVGFAGGLLTNYLLSVVWVFNQRRVTRTAHEFAIFTLVGLVGVGINELLLWLLTGHAHLPPVGSKLVATGVVYFWNFFARKKLLF